MAQENIMRLVLTIRMVLMLSNDRSSSGFVPIVFFRRKCRNLIWYPAILFEKNGLMVF